MSPLLFFAPLTPLAAPSPDAPIIIAATRLEDEEGRSDTPGTAIDPATVEALSPARHTDLLRLLASTALAETGPPGTQAQLRIRGAEANHTLLFINGIAANDPAASNEARFELLATPLGNRLELVPGPRSALWGSEAIGGVVALETLPAPSRLLVEGGSDRFFRADATVSVDSMTLTGGYRRSEGFDSFDGTGDDDGFENVTATFRGDWRAGPVDLRLSAFALDAHSEYDGFDPITFRRADTLDTTENRLGAARAAAAIGTLDTVRARLDGSFLASSNHNRLDGEALNDTSAERATTGIELERAFSIGGARVTGLLAADHRSEWFRARDRQYGGLTDQDRTRTNNALLTQWSARIDKVRIDAALRHDIFSEFEDATTVQGSLAYDVSAEISLFARYATGIAQPSFTDLFGFFPGSFVGNPDLAPERSRGGEVGISVGRRSGPSFGLTLFEQQLEDEIVSTYDPETFLSGVANSDTSSRRRGLEVEAALPLDAATRITANYSYLDASEASVSEIWLDEIRRPAHRAALILTGEKGLVRYGATLAYVGERFDTDFDQFPAPRLRLAPYVLADARVAYALTDNLDLSVRGSNLFDSDYQDVIGYRTAGRKLFAGVDVRL
ncbi:TonB-dependent receptor [Sphingomicrobium sp. XHP0235]|uniref:TonB-dependent receptor plug domain-containing protein n=1 Tax=Sphingomicrobium aquimarinum TaxID=3133971 RepID=UPI0031FF0EE6